MATNTVCSFKLIILFLFLIIESSFISFGKVNVTNKLLSLTSISEKMLIWVFTSFKLVSVLYVISLFILLSKYTSKSLDIFV